MMKMDKAEQKLSALTKKLVALRQAIEIQIAAINKISGVLQKFINRLDEIEREHFPLEGQ